MSEKYKPSQEEIEKAEEMVVEGEMTPEQEKMSEIRANFYEKRKDMDAEQDVRRETYENGNIKRVSAVIDGHKFEVDFDRSGASVAKIDGYVLSDEEKRRIPDKYDEVVRELSVDDEEKVADKEIRKSALKGILK